VDLAAHLQATCLQDHVIQLPKLASGAFGQVYLLCPPAHLRTQGVPCDQVVKVQTINLRNPGAWENAASEMFVARMAGAAGIGPEIFYTKVCPPPAIHAGRFVHTATVMELFKTDLDRAHAHIHDTKGCLRAVVRDLHDLVLNLHTLGFAHNDLKPANVVVDFDAATGLPQTMRLIDYGFSQPLGAAPPIGLNKKGQPDYYPRRAVPYYSKFKGALGAAYRGALWDQGMLPSAMVDDAERMKELLRRLPEIEKEFASRPGLDDVIAVIAIEAFLRGVPGAP
jgi:serine/threonine protein kinase